MKRFVQIPFINNANRHLFATTKTINNVDFVQNDSFLKIVLNRPKALNSLNLQMIKDIAS